MKIPLNQEEQKQVVVNHNYVTQQIGLTLLDVIFLILFAFKVLGAINYSWFLVFFPLYFPFGLKVLTKGLEFAQAVVIKMKKK